MFLNIFAIRSITQTKKTMKETILKMLGILAAVLMLAACSEKDNNDDDNPLKPDTPINQGDWQTVSASGGTIEKGDIAITFPSGTFSSDTKVAVTEVKKGSILGEYEVSPFYQITLPLTMVKPLTVKVKCAETGDDINAILHVPATAISEGRQEYIDMTVKSTYKDGGYTLSLPAFDNGETTESVSLSIGIGHMMRIEDSDATRSSIKGWHIDVSPITWAENYENVKKLDMEETVRRAIANLESRGFQLATYFNREVPILIQGMEETGVMYQSRICNELNTVCISSKFLTHFGQDIAGTIYDVPTWKRTVIHELTHYYQAEYDPRWAPVKALVGGDIMVLYEAGAVWAEKLNDDGTPSTAFIQQYLGQFMESAKEYKKGVNHADIGYAAAALLEYFTKFRTSEGFDNKSVVELYKLWNKETLEYTATGLPGTSFEYIQEWADNHKSKFFIGDGYDDFVLKMATGKVLPGLKDLRTFIPSGNKNDNEFKNDGEIKFNGQCYPYGCHTNFFSLNLGDDFNKSGSYNNKQLKIEQNEDGVQTYVVVQTNNGKTLIDGKVRKGEPLIISGEKIESFRPSKDNAISAAKGVRFFLLTTNRNNEKTLPMDITVTLGDAEKPKISKVQVDRIIGHFKMNPIITGSYEFQGVDKRDKDYFNCSLTESGNTVHVKGTHKDVKGTSTDEATISFDIIGTKGGYGTWKIQNLKYHYLYTDTQEKNPSKSYFVVRHELRFELTDLPYGYFNELKDSAGKPYIWIRFNGSKEETGGLKVTDAYYKEETFSYGDTKTEECSGVVNYDQNKFEIALYIWE